MPDLYIIEAPGKRKGLSNMLWHLGIRDAEVMATVGHLGTNPDGFRPLAISRDFFEVGYRLKPEKERLASEIQAAAKGANKIYIATDDDQEGDVIARDVLRFCIDKEDHHRALRLRLKALSPSELQRAIDTSGPFDPLSSAPGDARRVIDRLIGALSSDNGAVGRVQGSALLMFQEQVPVVGVATYALNALDDKGPWFAKVPVYAGQEPPENLQVDGAAALGQSQMATLSNRVLNHDDILLTASIATGHDIQSVSRAMQGLYEKGKMTYLRSKDHAISEDSFRRLQAVAKICGAGFDPQRFTAVRDVAGEHSHEAPNAMILDVPVNRSMDIMSIEDQVLVHITRSLIDCGIPCQYEKPRLSDLANIPMDVQSLQWHRVIPTGERLWSSPPVEAGFQAWTREQSLLHFMSRNELGRPSTIVSHLEKFLSRDLVGDQFDLTPKGREWSANIGHHFGHKNISKMVEQYLDNHKKPPHEMVAELITLCGLNSVDTMVQQQGLASDEDYEVSAGYVH